MIKKLLNAFGFLILIICITITLLMLVSAISLSWKLSISNILLVIITLILNLLMIFVSVKLNRYSTKAFMLWIVLVSVILYTVWNLYAVTSPISDYQVLLEGAAKIINGSFKEESFNKESYFYFYNYQIGYTSYLALVMKIFNNNLFWFKALEALYMTLTSVIIYKITAKISTNDIAAISSTLYVFYIPNIMGSSVINNQHLSTLLIVIALYFILVNKLKNIVIAGALIGLSQILRPAAIIVIIGVFILFFFNMLKDKDHMKWILRFATFILAFVIVVNSFDKVLIRSGISPSPISKSNAKYFKFVLGLKGTGIYNIPTENARKTQVYQDLKALGFDYDKYNEECASVINASLKDFNNTSVFVKKKMYYFLGYRDNQYYFALTEDKVTSFVYKLVDMGQIQYILLVACALLTFLFRFLKGKDKYNIDIFGILIVGFILVHIFIETQPRYRYEVYVFICILAAQLVGNLNETYKEIR